MTDTPPPGPDDSFGHAASTNGDGRDSRLGPDAGRTDAQDPTADDRDVDRAWAEVGERFAELGRALKERQRQRRDQPASQDPDAGDAVWDAGAEPADAAPGREEPAGGGSDTGPARQVIDALDEAFTALGDTVRDEAFQQEARGTLRALGAALGATFTDLGQQLQERFDRPEQR